MKLEFTYESLKDYFGQNSSLDGAIWVLGEVENARDEVGIDIVDEVGIDVTRNSITLIEIGETCKPIGSIMALKEADKSLIVKYLQAYLLTNEGCLEKATEDELNHLINLF